MVPQAHIAAKINTNSHGMLAVERRRTLAIGLFPTVSLANHSCEPNMYYSPYRETPDPSDLCETRAYTKMVLRAVRDIKVGEELTLSYIDTNETRETRQRLLKAEKHFHCQCKCVHMESDRRD